MILNVSSTFNENEECCSRQYAIDRVWSFHNSHGYYVSKNSSNPWFMMTFDEEILLEKVIITNSWLELKREQCTFQNITVRAGLDLIPRPPDGGRISENEECVRNEKNTSDMGKEYSFKCISPVEAKIITIQRIDDIDVILVFDEVEIIGKGKCS